MFDTLISTVTVGAGGAASITFSGIPATFSDLSILLSAKCTTSPAPVTIAFNGSSANFQTARMTYDGSTQASVAGTTQIGFASVLGNTAFGNIFIYITNYAGATTKTLNVDSATETNSASANLTFVGGSWADNTAINSITLSLANFDQYSSASLYGITRGSLAGVTVA